MKIFNKLLLIIVLVCYLMYGFTTTIYACPHYDEYGDEYFLIFDEDYNATMFYYKDDHERQIHLDEHFNIKHEDFLIILQPADFEGLKINEAIAMGNYNYWFELPIKNLLTDKVLKEWNELFRITYTLNTVVLNNNHRERLEKINNALSKINGQTMEDKAIDIQFKIAYEYRNATSTEVMELKNFTNPINVSYDLSHIALSEEEISSLKAVYFKPDNNGKYQIVELGGHYDKQKKHFSFNTSDTGIHSVILEKFPLKETQMSIENQNLKDKREDKELNIEESIPRDVFNELDIEELGENTDTDELANIEEEKSREDTYKNLLSEDIGLSSSSDTVDNEVEDHEITSANSNRSFLYILVLSIAVVSLSVFLCLEINKKSSKKQLKP